MVSKNWNANMLKSIFGKFAAKVPGKTAHHSDAITPDISRVIKIRQEEASSHEGQTESETHFDTASLGDRAEAAVDDLSGQFEAWMQMDLDRLTEAWGIAQQDGATAGDYEALNTSAHNIHGVASSYGYPAISRLCGSLCALLSETAPGENSALINLHVEACRAAHKSIGRGDGQAVADAVCDALEKRVAVKTANA